jgi:release factor glutamine methyltransferase
VLVAHLAGRDRSWVLAHPDAPGPEGLDDLVARRAAGEPLAYLLGWREFAGHRFEVRPGVLVPRQETETLVEAVLDGPGGTVLDVGTGTGCLAVTIKLARPNWLVAAVDVSRTAVRLARANAQRLGAEVFVVRGDLLTAFHGQRFAVIVSNPPYVRLDADLPRDVRWEPPEALFAGPDGLGAYRRLAEQARGRLVPWGRLVVEIGDDMEAAVAEVFAGQGWTVQAVRPDLAGRPRAMTLGLGPS